jgi:hypothetical protein
MCNQWRSVEWTERGNILNCHVTQASYIPPTPAQQHDAYVDIHEWPDEMEKVVITAKGNKYIVPGCSKIYETLDHRIPWSQGGHTSVSNLFPMCDKHNQSKDDTNYSEWLATKP